MPYFAGKTPSGVRYAVRAVYRGAACVTARPPGPGRESVTKVEEGACVSAWLLYTKASLERSAAIEAP